MQIVIDIDEHIYKQIMADSQVYVLDNEVDRILIENAIYNGIPLPEHLNKIKAEIAEYGSICVAYAITDKTKTDKGIEELVTNVLSEAKRQALDIIDKYKAESEDKDDKRTEK